MKIKTVTAAVVILLFTAACQQAGPKESVGTLGGAALGGLLGSQFGSGKGQLAATGAGVFLGALIGNQIGRGLDDVDRIKIDQANARAKGAPIGETIAWNNPSTGNSGTVTPAPDGHGLLELAAVDRDRRGQYRTSLRHGLPTAGWQLADRSVKAREFRAWLYRGCRPWHPRSV